MDEFGARVERLQAAGWQCDADDFARFRKFGPEDYESAVRRALLAEGWEPETSEDR